MKITVLARGGGKTTRAIKECRETGAVLVVCTAQEKKRLLERNALPPSQIATFEELQDGDLSRMRGYFYPTITGRPEFIIDNADLLLRLIIPFGRIRAVTMSRPLNKAERAKYGINYDKRYEVL